MSPIIPHGLDGGRPNRKARRAAEANGFADARRPAPSPVQQAQQQQQVAVGLGHNATHVLLGVSIGGQQMAIPMTPDQWDAFAEQGDIHAEAVRNPPPPPAPEAAEYLPEDRAEALRVKIERAANDYGKATVSAAMAESCFRHHEHLRNWARKHHMDVEADVATSDVTFRPAPSVLTSGDSLEAPTPG